MASGHVNKHAARSADTRLRFIRTAQKLFAERGVDSVSLNEITLAAGQKNRNALQYHFGSRKGLIQAILDYHADAVEALRNRFLESAHLEQWRPAERVARTLVTPLGEYLKQNPEGVYYVRMLSQLAATSSPATNPGNDSQLNFRKVAALEPIVAEALSHLSQAEARQRLFLALSINFHSIADICSAFGSKPRQRNTMLDQVAGAIAAMLEAPART
ncbi:TetR/AcrR family transcriptional regulator [Halioglobus maricola]|uniref:TetR/AcrR family transcriptional regulator n=1 Tax=Halioglobus maricola TaxID=2601894 RepID=A0A5P9NIL0_9GAMM|nr:helix-turn-helix domain-containing protein [Halioglobus maricola]QFU75663.1 TetR/AcrR family transcriptional regulator [Halioglobus maricola]